jgi:4-hydroxyacetophenone monooxygenase
MPDQQLAGADVRNQYTHNVPQTHVSAEEFRKHVVVAPTYQLLLSAVHVTGNPSLLDSFQDRVGGPPPLTPLPDYVPKVEDPAARSELIDILAETLSRDDQAPYVGVTDHALFQRMSNLAAGFEVPAGQLEMNIVQCGFGPDGRSVPPTRQLSKSISLAILGAGMTGIDAAVKAKERGFEFDVYDLEGGPGGLWWSQNYPGVAVDTPSVYYSLSWEVEPNWSRSFPLGAEYREYLRRVVDKYELAPHLHFNSEVTKLEWLDEEQVWELTIVNTLDHSSTTVHAAAVITAAGHLNRPKYPNVTGIGSFEGESIHTGKWRDVEVKGKRVGVVGVGAAGVQVVASVAPVASHLTVFQRQPHWISPNTIGTGIVSDSERWLRKNLPYYLQWSRFAIFVVANDISHKGNEVDEEWYAEHPESISPFNEFVRQVVLQNINDTFGEGTELAKKLTPDFAPGAKRPVRDPGDDGPGGYYWAYKQPHVDLVTEAVAKIVPEGIVTADGKLTELDVIIWATGMTLDWLSPIEIIGRAGVHLADVWAGNNPRTYLGGTIPGFPNLFVNDGPNTGVANGGGGHNFMTETVNHFIFETLQLLVENDATSIEVTQEAHDEFNARIEEAMSKLIWSYDRRADTYYRNEAGRIILPSPFLPEEYWSMSQTPEVGQFLLHSRSALEGAVRRP